MLKFGNKSPKKRLEGTTSNWHMKMVDNVNSLCEQLVH
jgi:hypothetical protein